MPVTAVNLAYSLVFPMPAADLQIDRTVACWKVCHHYFRKETLGDKRTGGVLRWLFWKLFQAYYILGTHVGVIDYLKIIQYSLRKK